jgi:Tol biopolymer transport system component
MTRSYGHIARIAIFIAILGALTAHSVRQAVAQSTQMPGRLLANTYPGSGGLFEVNTDDTNLVNLTPNTYNGALNRNDTQPSVSADGKHIAFASYRNSTNGQTHIWIMNSDGTNVHALTFDGYVQTGNGANLSPTAIIDQYPVISPDGTKIAFVSNRTTAVANFGGSMPYTYDSHDLYVINTDGTHLHRVTSPAPNNYGGGPFGSVIFSAAWGPDSNRLAVKGTQFVFVNGSASYPSLVFFIQADGTGFTYGANLSSTGEWGAVAWSPNGRYIAVPYGGEAQGAAPFRFYIVDIVSGATRTLFYNSPQVASGVNLDGFLPGTFRFSPDSTQILFPTTTDYETDHPAIANLDGTGVRVLTTGLGRFTWLWWQGGPAVPTPARLTLTGNVPPDLLLLHAGQPGVAVQATLYDTNGKVIVHAVSDWTPSDVRFFTLDVNGVATPIQTAEYGALSLTADNGGITSNTLEVMIDQPILGGYLTNVSKYGDGTIRIDGNITNSGPGTAANLVITSLTLDGQPAEPNLYGTLPPYFVGDLMPGRAAYQNALFPPSSKPSGTTVQLKVTGTYDWGGTFTATLPVVLP